MKKTWKSTLYESLSILFDPAASICYAVAIAVIAAIFLTSCAYTHVKLPDGASYTSTKNVKVVYTETKPSGENTSLEVVGDAASVNQANLAVVDLATGAIMEGVK